ncbi:hypothetical protein ACS5NO_32805, partial [Larkinella sp. GY13]|uniref:hypothetical protein n=1 Tax=Larkinella sp. GY13 TaxID=3453720 RepID=UPI003EEE5C6D
TIKSGNRYSTKGRKLSKTVRFDEKYKPKKMQRTPQLLYLIRFILGCTLKCLMQKDLPDRLKIGGKKKPV